MQTLFTLASPELLLLRGRVVQDLFWSKRQGF